jgi:hypothetical protein
MRVNRARGDIESGAHHSRVGRRRLRDGPAVLLEARCERSDVLRRIVGLPRGEHLQGKSSSRRLLDRPVKGLAARGGSVDADDDVRSAGGQVIS